MDHDRRDVRTPATQWATGFLPMTALLVIRMGDMAVAEGAEGADERGGDVVV